MWGELHRVAAIALTIELSTDLGFIHGPFHDSGGYVPDMSAVTDSLEDFKRLSERFNAGDPQAMQQVMGAPCMFTSMAIKILSLTNYLLGVDDTDGALAMMTHGMFEDFYKLLADARREH